MWIFVGEPTFSAVGRAFVLFIPWVIIFRVVVEICSGNAEFDGYTKNIIR
jgi:hypothetical protein